MADNKDNKQDDKGTKPDLTASSSLDKPLLDDEPVEERADIDTSHLTLDDSTAQTGGSLETERVENAPAIETSHLSLQNETKSPDSKLPESGTEQTPAPTKGHETANEELAEAGSVKSEPDDAALIIDNPYVKKGEADTTSDKPEASSEETPEDEQVMLTTGLSDEEFEKEAQSEDTKDTPLENDFESEFNAEETGAIKQLLDTVKKPETVVRSAWSNSSARRYLLDNVDSYREKDEDQNMENVIEKMYGGAAEGKFSPGKFLKENILFSILISILLFLVGWKAAGVLFPDYMPAINDQIITTVKKSTTGKPKIKPQEEQKPIVTNIANKEVIEEKLSHCLISSDARSQFVTAFSGVGFEYSNPKLTLSYEEVSAAIDTWDGLNMDFFIKDAILRFRVLNSLSLPLIQDAHKTVSDYNQSLIDIKSKAKDLDKRIKNIQTAGGNQSTVTVNKRIPLRNELNKLETRLADEPERERFTEILSKFSLLEKILSGENLPDRIDSDESVEVGQEWLVKIADTESTTIGNEIEKVIVPSIQKPSDKLKQVSPKLTDFYLSELEIALNDVLNLAALITFVPENKLNSYKLELSGLNRRLNNLMKKELPSWIGFNQCLSQKRTEVLSNLE